MAAITLENSLGGKAGIFGQTMTVAAAVPTSRVIVAAVAANTSSPQTLSISDSQGNTWSLIPGTTTTDNMTVALFCTQVTHALSTSDTISSASTNYGSAGWTSVGAASFRYAQAIGYAGSVIASTLPNPATVTSSAPIGGGDLALTVVARAGNGTASAPGGAWSLLNTAGLNGLSYWFYYQVPVATGTVSASFSIVSGVVGAAAIGAVRGRGTSGMLV